MTNLRVTAHLALEQFFQCHYCGVRMRFPRHHHEVRPTRMTQEHLQPSGQGGSDEITNKVASCSRCNVMRGDLDYDVFKEALGQMFQIEFIRMHWHTNDLELYRLLRKMFRYQVDVILSRECAEAAQRVQKRRHKVETYIDEAILLLAASAAMPLPRQGIP